MPARVEQFMLGWLALPRDQRTVLGGGPEPRVALGRGLVVGARVRDVQSRFRIVLGPMDLDRYIALPARRPEPDALVDWVRNYVGFEFDWELQLVLARDEVPGIRLGREGQLGWTTWLGTRRASTDADDLTSGAGAPAASPERIAGGGLRGLEHGGDQPRGAVRQAQPADVQGGRRARSRSASCAAIRTSSSCTGSSRSSTCPTRICTASCVTSRSTAPASSRDLQAALERLPRGASAIEDFSEHVPYAVKEGWMYGDPPVRRVAGAQRLPAGRDPQERSAARRAARASRASSTRSRSRRSPTTSRASSRARRRTA